MGDVIWVLFSVCCESDLQKTIVLFIVVVVAKSAWTVASLQNDLVWQHLSTRQRVDSCCRREFDTPYCVPILFLAFQFSLFCCGVFAGWNLSMAYLVHLYNLYRDRWGKCMVYTHHATKHCISCTLLIMTRTIGGTKVTRGSAIAEEPRDALRRLKYYGRFLTELLTRSSANPEEPCEHTVSWNRVKCCTNVRRIACENICNRWMTFKVIQGHCRCHHLIGHILFPISLPL